MLERSRPGPPRLHPGRSFYLLFPLASLSLFVLLECHLPASLSHEFVLFLPCPAPSLPPHACDLLILVSSEACRAVGGGSPTAVAPQPSLKGAQSIAVGEGVRGLVCRS